MKWYEERYSIHELPACRQNRTPRSVRKALITFWVILFFEVVLFGSAIVAFMERGSQ